MISTPVPYDVAATALKDGSPMLLNAVGRAFGLGPTEQDALGTGTVPGWAYLTIGILAGVALGIQAQKRVPQYTKWIGGGR